MRYAFFLLALFVMACGQCFLEVAANPYVTVLGPPESAARRLNTAQAFNSVGALVTPILGATFILSGVEYSKEQLAAMGPEAVDLYRITEAQAVRGPAPRPGRGSPAASARSEAARRSRRSS